MIPTIWGADDFRLDGLLMLIDGELTAGSSDSKLEVVNPATESVLARVPAATSEDVDRAISAAHRTRTEWRNTPMDRRSDCLRELSRRLRNSVDFLAHLESLDSGNTIGAMRNDVLRAAKVIDYNVGLGPELKGSSIPSSSGGMHFSIREPFGVVGRIIPFNHPVMFAAEKIAAPLMAGNTVVLKLPPEAPLTGLCVADLASDIFPAGVLNVITGDGLVGSRLTSDPRVRRIALTGSVATGKAIIRQSSEHLPVVSLELGGKNASIVFPDANVESVVAGATTAMNFAWQGQSCGSATRLFVHTSLYDRILEGLTQRFRNVAVGDPTIESTEMGPLISQRQHSKVLDMIKSGIADGARLVAGGTRPEGADFQRGFWMLPTLFADVKTDMRIAREEIFGPVLCVFEWHEEDDVVTMANSTEYGLVANIWTRDINTALRICPLLDVGYVTVNGKGQHFEGLPFGGYKQSGLGREESLDELLSYTELKSISFLPA